MATNNGKAIFITGANGGMGSILVPMLLAHGWRVYAGVNTTNTLQPHANLTIVQLDIASDDSIQTAVRSISERQGSAGLQALVNLAGIMIEGPLELVPDPELRRAFDVNVFGPTAIVRHCLPLLRSGKGRIINITAITALASGPFFGPTAASKAALAYLSDSLRMELAPQGIPVVNIMPSAMKTPVFKTATAAFERSLAAVPAELIALYQPLIAGAHASLAQQKESDPAVAVRVILKAIETAKPKSHYFAGREAKLAGHLIPYLPRRVKDRMLTAMVGGGK